MNKLGDSVVKESACNEGDLENMGSIPGSGRSPGGGNSNPLQYSYLENPMDRGAWQATVPRVKKSQTQLKQLSMHTQSYTLWGKRTHFYFCSFYRVTFYYRVFQICKSGVNNVINFYVSITQLPQLSVFYQSCIINSLGSVFKSTFSSTSGNAKHNHLLLSC